MVVLIACPDATYASALAMKAVKKDFPTRDETNFVSFNMAVVTPLELAREAEFLPLGTERKCIVADNCAFLQKPVRGAKKVVYEGIDELQAFLENPADYTDLYLLVHAEAVDEKSPLVAAIKKKGKVMIEKIPDEGLLRSQMNAFLSKRGCSIEPDAAAELIARAGDNYARFVNEVKKLSTYANGEPIRLEAVKRLVPKKIEENVFALSEALLVENISKAFRIYYDLKTGGMDEVPLIGLLATSFRFLDEVAYLDASGRSKKEISLTLSANEWRVGKTLQTIYGVKRSNIALVLEQLYETDKLILSGSCTPEFAFTRFLANFSLK